MQQLVALLPGVVVAAGVAAGSALPGRALWFAALGACALAALGLTRDRRRAAALVLLALAAAGAADAGWRTGAGDASLFPKLAVDRRVARMCGTVTERGPRSAVVQARRVSAGGRSWTVREDVRVSGDGVRRLRPGHAMCAVGEVAPARPARDEPPLLVADEIGLRGVGSPLRYAAGVVRARFASAARGALPHRHAGLLLGMTDGDTAFLDDRVKEDFRTTGLAHIVAVSGYNVAVFLALTMLLARAVVRRGRWLRAAIAVPPLVFFVFLTGLQPSVLRATVSAGVVLAVTAGGRTSDALRAAAFAFVALVLAVPDMLFSIGAQLSFGATLGILLGGEALAERLTAISPRLAGPRWQTVIGGFATTVAAQIAVAPLLALHFGRIPGLGAAANVVAIPLGGFVMIGGLATLTAATLVPFLGWAPATMRLPLDAILAASRAFAGLPGASVEVGIVVALALTAVVIFAAARSRRVRYGAMAFAVACSAVGTGQAMAGGIPGCPADGEVRALDVGQGTSVLLRAAGHAVLVDGGKFEGDVVGQLEDLGVGRLDAAFASHPHADHTEGVADAIRKLDVATVLGPQTLAWGVGEQVLRSARGRRVPVRTVARGDVLRFGPGIEVEVLSPEPGPAPEETPSLIHPFSLVLRARVGGLEVLLPGDIGADTGAQLAGPELRVPVLVAPHHGSADVDEGFVEAVDAEVTLITVGTGNSYGFPRPEALALYRPRGPVLRTDTDGTSVVCGSAGALELSTSR